MNASFVDNRTETALSRPGNDSAGRLDTPRMPCGRNQGWAVVHTHPQAERWAASNISRIGYRVFLPLYAALVRDPVLPVRTSRSDATRTRTAMRPLFPRYLFVWLTGPWVPIRYAPGVADLLMTDGKPAYAPERDLEAIRAGEDARRHPCTSQSLYRPGAACACLLGGGQRVDAVVISVRGRKAVVAAVMLGALREVTVGVESLRPRGE